MEEKNRSEYEKVKTDDFDLENGNELVKEKAGSNDVIVEEDGITEIGQISLLASSKYSLRHQNALLDLNTSTYIKKDDEASVKKVSIHEKQEQSSPNKYRHLYGYMFIVLSSLCFSMSAIFLKRSYLLAGSDNSVIRYAIQLVTMLIVCWYKQINIIGKKSQIKLLSLRGAIGVVGIVCLHFSVTMIAPSDAIAIANSSVIFTAVLAKIFLKEKFTVGHIFSLILTIVGVVLISQPSFLFQKNSTTQTNSVVSLNRTNCSIETILKNRNLTLDSMVAELESRDIFLDDLNHTKCMYTMYNQYKKYLNDTSEDEICMEELEAPVVKKYSMKFYLGVLFGLCYAVGSGCVQILLKKLCMVKVHFTVTTIYASYFGLPISLLISTVLFLTGVSHKHFKHELHFHMLPMQIVYSVISAFCGIASQICLNLALSYEDASKISILRTVDLLFTFVLQFLLLGIKPDLISICGAVFILSGSFFIIGYKIFSQRKNQKN